MSKEWHENIPENGVLCKDDTGEIQLITKVKGIFGFRGLDYGYPLSKLTPLTADEFWDFAPWRDMRDAPEKQKILILFSDSVTRIMYFNPEMLNYDAYPVKWMSLPTG